MLGMRVGVEVRATEASVFTAMATLPWMSPERIALDESRSLVLVHTSFQHPDDACAYAERRIKKSAVGMGLELTVLSTEAYPPTTIDLRGHTVGRDWSSEPDAHP